MVDLNVHFNLNQFFYVFLAVLPVGRLGQSYIVIYIIIFINILYLLLNIIMCLLVKFIRPCNKGRCETVFQSLKFVIYY